MIYLPNSDTKCHTLIDLLDNRAKSTPDKIVYSFINNDIKEEITYSVLHERARTIAGMLKRRVRIGDRIILMYGPGIEFIVAYWGCLYAGAVAVPVIPPQNLALTEKLSKIISNAKPTLLLSTQKIITKLNNLSRLKRINNLPVIRRFTEHYWDKELKLAEWDMDQVTWLATDELEIKEQDFWSAPNLSEHNLAFLQYTSGSTGNPKGVMVSHSNLLHNLEQINKTFEIKPDDTIVSWLPPYHDMGLIGGILEPLFSGGSAILMSPIEFIKKTSNMAKSHNFLPRSCYKRSSQFRIRLLSK
ncbi:acyl-CoA synthetase [Legionella hackeliae]|uniref:AMP-binding protein n=1 Tax=Legionella hackeliae TaxID=449 RepID=UPI000E14B65E|nr:AMP-binding protein [Legionella hackeliae]STX48385.1 acyl-CoA synthetase [Legionella hackeliae]